MGASTNGAIGTSPLVHRLTVVAEVREARATVLLLLICVVPSCVNSARRDLQLNGLERGSLGDSLVVCAVAIATAGVVAFSACAGDEKGSDGEEEGHDRLLGVWACSGWVVGGEMNDRAKLQ